MLNVFMYMTDNEGQLFFVLKQNLQFMRLV